MDTEEKKLTSSEIDELLKEAEEFHQPIRKTNNNRKKKPKVRIDMIIAGVVALVLIVGVVSLIAHFVKKSGNSTAKSVSENPLQEEKYPEISDVVKNYLNAYLIEDSQQRLSILAQYVDNMGDIGDVSQKKYVAGYSDIECYTKDGPYENTYVVYAYYQMEYKNISTRVPAVDTLYVIRDTNTGNVYIHNGISSDVKTYINNVTKDQDVQDLLNDVNKEFEEVLNSDEQLKALYGKIQTTTAAEAESTAAASNQPGTTQAAATQQATTQPSTKK
ncbi:MAG: hypothetical protein ACLRZ9_09800 [Eubacterium sp.]